MTPASRIVTGCVLASAALAASAREEPLWEAGVGVGALAFPDYRGADEGSVYPVPMPYFVYRGEFLKADDNGVRGRLFNREYAELSFSFNGTVPVDSEDNSARSGMPDLEPTIELGPSLDLHLWKSADRTVKVDLVLPLRAPFTLESSPQSIGWVFSPRINLDIEDIGGAGWKFGVGAGPAFADSKYHAYFYDVAPRYETPERPGYRSRGGYSGSYLITSLSKRYPKYWVGAFLRYDMLGGAEFEDSPLVKRSTSLFGGVGIAWIVGRSKRMVDVKD
jgi:outer membrane scaffolding protein for murein synthesis (MipA/OmpV family)